MLAEFVAFIGVGMIIVSDAPLAKHFDVGSVGYGLLVAVWGLGMIGGAWWAGRALKERQEPMALLIGSLVTAAGLAICAVLPWFWLILVSSIAAGGGHGLQNVARQGIVQRRSPDTVRSRVFAAVEAIANVAFIASLAVAGPLVEEIGPRAGYGVGGVIWILGALAARAGGAALRRCAQDGGERKSRSESRMTRMSSIVVRGLTMAMRVAGAPSTLVGTTKAMPSASSFADHAS